jgi:hypothetical protein
MANKKPPKKRKSTGRGPAKVKSKVDGMPIIRRPVKKNRKVSI